MIRYEGDRIVVDAARTVAALVVFLLLWDGDSLDLKSAEPMRASLMGSNSHLRRCMRRQGHGGFVVLS